MTIQPGQIYVAVKPSEAHPREHYIRIKVVGKPITMHGLYGYGKVDVVTLTDAGREVRRRAIDCSQLHASATTKTGQPRRTGYVLEAGQ